MGNPVSSGRPSANPEFVSSGPPSATQAPPPTASVPAPPPQAVAHPTIDPLAELKAMILAQQATIEKLTIAAATPRVVVGMSPAESVSMATDIAAMSGVGEGTLNARNENAPVPRHAVTGLPIFNAARPTGRTG